MVVRTSDQPPQATIKKASVESGSGIPNGDPAYADEGYRKWAITLPGSRRACVETAWYLWILVAGSDELDEDPVTAIGATRPPWFARHSVV